MRHPKHRKLEVFSDGRIFNRRTRKFYATFKAGSGGYFYVGVNGKPRRVNVLVAEAFHGPRPVGYQCAHLDGDKYNNCADNLKWVTPKENVAHSFAHGRRGGGEKTPAAKLTNAQAKDIRRRYIPGANRNKPGNALLLANEFKVSKATIHRVTSGRSYVEI